MEQMSEYRGKYSATETLRKLMKIMSYGMDLIRDGEVLQDSIYALDSSLNELNTCPDTLTSVPYNQFSPAHAQYKEQTILRTSADPVPHAPHALLFLEKRHL